MSVAAKRARELLFSFLTPEQQKSYEICGWFDVKSHDGKRTYRLSRHGAPTMIEPKYERVELTTFPHWRGRVTVWPPASYCIHMPEVPQDDYNLAMAMLLTSKKGERHFHGIANW